MPDPTSRTDPDPAAAENPFALLGVPQRYDLDDAALQRAWLKHSARLHPDRAPDDGEAAGRLARINDAKRTLEDPEKRANALLAALGGPSKEQDTSLPDGFLMEMFELREEHEAGDEATRERLEAWGATRRKEHEARIGERFASLSEPPTAEELRAIREELNAWRYIERFLSEPGLA